MISDNTRAEEIIRNEAKVNWPNENFNIIRDASYNVGFGFQFKRAFTKRIAIDYGFQYSPTIQKFNYHLVTYNIKNKGSIILNYLRIPLLFEYEFVKWKRGLFFISGGPQLSILTSDLGAIPIFDFSGYETGATGFIFDLYDPRTVYKKLILDGVVAVGGEFKITNKTSFFIQPRLESSLTKVIRDDFVDYSRGNNAIFKLTNITIRTKHNVSVGVVTGFSYSIR